MPHLFMRVSFIIGFMLISFNVISQSIKIVEVLNGDFEKFEMKDFVDKRDRTIPGGDDLNRFFLKDGTEIYRVGYAEEYTEEIIFPKPSFYKLNKTFYPSGFIKEKGFSFGELDMGANGIKVGKWYYFDELGKLTKTIDEDLKFGKFGYQKVLKFLDKEGMISLKTGKNRNKTRMFFNERGDNQWYIEVITEFAADDYAKRWEYTLDGDSGKVLKKVKVNISYVQ